MQTDVKYPEEVKDQSRQYVLDRLLKLQGRLNRRRVNIAPIIEQRSQRIVESRKDG